MRAKKSPTPSASTTPYHTDPLPESLHSSSRRLLPNGQVEKLSLLLVSQYLRIHTTYLHPKGPFGDPGRRFLKLTGSLTHSAGIFNEDWLNLDEGQYVCESDCTELDKCCSSAPVIMGLIDSRPITSSTAFESFLDTNNGIFRKTEIMLVTRVNRDHV